MVLGIEFWSLHFLGKSVIELATSHMNGSENVKPTNTSRKIGAVSAAAGAALYIGAAIIFAVGFSLKLDILYIAIFATFLAIGTLTLVIGVGMLFQGRKVDKLLSGKDLIAKWNYNSGEIHDEQSGYVYIGTKDVYSNGQYTSWSKKCSLENVYLSEKDSFTLTFQYILRSDRPDMRSTRTVRKRLIVPVPIVKKDDAIKVVAYYKQQLQVDSQQITAD